MMEAHWKKRTTQPFHRTLQSSVVQQQAYHYKPRKVFTFFLKDNTLIYKEMTARQCRSQCVGGLFLPGWTILKGVHIKEASHLPQISGESLHIPATNNGKMELYYAAFREFSAPPANMNRHVIAYHLLFHDELFIHYIKY